VGPVKRSHRQSGILILGQEPTARPLRARGIRVWGLVGDPDGSATRQDAEPLFSGAAVLG